MLDLLCTLPSLSEGPLVFVRRVFCENPESSNISSHESTLGASSGLTACDFIILHSFRITLLMLLLFHQQFSLIRLDYFFFPECEWRAFKEQLVLQLKLKFNSSQFIGPVSSIGNFSKPSFNFL